MYVLYSQISYFRLYSPNVSFEPHCFQQNFTYQNKHINPIFKTKSPKKILRNLISPRISLLFCLPIQCSRGSLLFNISFYHVRDVYIYLTWSGGSFGFMFIRRHLVGVEFCCFFPIGGWSLTPNSVRANTLPCCSCGLFYSVSSRCP